MSTIKDDPLVNRLLDFIGKTEANGNYNAVWNKAGSKKDLSMLTVDQVLDQMRATVARGGQSATGRYQFILKTALAIKAALKTPGTEKFTEELQDRWAIYLLQQRGLSKFKAGAFTAEQFGNELAKEWASFPVMDDSLKGHRKGNSFYAGDGLNKSLITTDQVLHVLKG